MLNIEIGELEGPDEWIDYELSDLIAIRDELIAGDQRALYIAWLASQPYISDGPRNSHGDEVDDDYYGENDGAYYEGEEDDEGEEEDEDGEDDEDENKKNNADADGENSIPPVPPGFGKLTAAQKALAELLQVPPEMLRAAALHSRKAVPSAKDDFASWLKLLPQKHKDEYLLRLANNEPGLSPRLVKALRELNPNPNRILLPTGECVPYETILAESTEAKAQLVSKKRAKEEAALQNRLQDIHDHQDTFWGQVNAAATRVQAQATMKLWED